MPRPTILIIDDQPSMLNLLIEAFEPAGFDVLVALQGEMALMLLNQVTPDVILLDAMMPGIDGFETCRRLKQRPGSGPGAGDLHDRPVGDGQHRAGAAGRWESITCTSRSPEPGDRAGETCILPTPSSPRARSVRWMRTGRHLGGG